MPTSKPKIAGYLNQDLFDKFKAFASDNNFSDSQAIAHILQEYFGGSPMNQGELPSSTSRLDSLEVEVRLLKDMYTPIYDKLFRGESRGESQGRILDDILNLDDLPSDLPSEPPVISSDLPSEPPVISSDLPSEPPVISSDLPSELPGELLPLSPEEALAATLQIIRENPKPATWEDIINRLEENNPPINVYNARTKNWNKPTRLNLGAIAKKYNIPH